MRALLLMPVLLLSACSSVPLYVAEDPAFGEELRHCGAPNAWWKVAAAGGTVSVAAIPCSEGVCGTMSLSFPQAATVILVSGSVTVANETESQTANLAEIRTKQPV